MFVIQHQGFVLVERQEKNTHMPTQFINKHIYFLIACYSKALEKYTQSHIFFNVITP